MLIINKFEFICEEHNMFPIYFKYVYDRYVYTNTQGFCSGAFAYMWLHHQWTASTHPPSTPWNSGFPWKCDSSRSSLGVRATVRSICSSTGWLSRWPAMLALISCWQTPFKDPLDENSASFSVRLLFLNFSFSCFCEEKKICPSSFSILRAWLLNFMHFSVSVKYWWLMNIIVLPESKSVF